MRKRILFSIIFYLIFSITVTCYADRFTLRDGIRWGMSFDEVEEKIKKEPGSVNYEIINFTEEYDKQFPNYKGAMWAFYVMNVDLGNSKKESVILAFEGTGKYGLHDIDYIIGFASTKDEDIFSRANELIAQIEKKYSVKFKTYVNKWSSRKNAKDGEKVFEKSVQLKNYENTWITLRINKTEKSYGINIQYVVPNYDNIKKEIEDGSYFIEAPFGL